MADADPRRESDPAYGGEDSRDDQYVEHGPGHSTGETASGHIDQLKGRNAGENTGERLMPRDGERGGQGVAAGVGERNGGHERRRDRVRRYARVPLAVRTSDLPKRAASALVMLAIVAMALVLGGWLLDLLVIAVAAATYWEWQRLVRERGQVHHRPLSRAAALIWMLTGAAYIGLAALLMIRMPIETVILVLTVTILVDTGAYFAGRTIGGPKIAPRISPSKTWAGLGGGVFGATAGLLGFVAVVKSDGLRGSFGMLPDLFDHAGNDGVFYVLPTVPQFLFVTLVSGALIACVAQAGDFFESWMKRRAAMKDSSALIPGHGGVFDRVDGMMPVAILIGLFTQGLR